MKKCVVQLTDAERMRCDGAVARLPLIEQYVLRTRILLQVEACRPS